TGSSAGSITLGNGGGSGTFSGVLHGNGNATDGSMEGGVLSLNKTGSGTQILSGVNTYSGTTAIFAGTLQVNGSGVLAGGGNYSNTISNSGALVYNSVSNQTFAGVMSGTGSLTQ